MRDFIRGIRDYMASFAWFRRTPKQMRNALVPAVAAWLLLAVAVVTFAAFLPAIIIAMTPFASDWHATWATIFRVGAALGLLGAVLYLATKLYRSLVLAIGEHAYGRLRRAVAMQVGSPLEPRREGATRVLGSALLGLFTGIPLAIMVFLLSLIPVIGFVLSWVVAAVAAGREFGEDLVAPTLQDDAVIAANRNRIAGFGMVANLMILIPFAGMFAMPVAVAGATALATKMASDNPTPQ